MTSTYLLPQLKGCVFIVTYGRSGSTLLQSILQTIPGACIRGENHGLVEALFRAHRRSSISRYQFGARATAPDHPWFGADGIDVDTFGFALSNVFIQSILRPPQNSRWIGFKEIRYHEVGDDFEELLIFMKKYFPNAFFVFNKRPAEQVAQSGWFARQPAENVYSMVNDQDRRFDDFAKKFPSCTFITEYEKTKYDFQYLEALFQKLGEPFDIEEIQKRLLKPLNH